jgi:hypothetical protein
MLRYLITRGLFALAARPAPAVGSSQSFWSAALVVSLKEGDHSARSRGGRPGFNRDQREGNDQAIAAGGTRLGTGGAVPSDLRPFGDWRRCMASL